MKGGGGGTPAAAAAGTSSTAAAGIAPISLHIPFTKIVLHQRQLELLLRVSALLLIYIIAFATR